MVQTPGKVQEPGCKRRRGGIDLGGDRSMEVQKYDTRHGPGRLKGLGRVQEPWMMQGP